MLPIYREFLQSYETARKLAPAALKAAYQNVVDDNPFVGDIQLFDVTGVARLAATQGQSDPPVTILWHTALPADRMWVEVENLPAGLGPKGRTAFALERREGEMLMVFVLRVGPTGGRTVSDTLLFAESMSSTMFRDRDEFERALTAAKNAGVVPEMYTGPSLRTSHAVRPAKYQKEISLLHAAISIMMTPKLTTVDLLRVPKRDRGAAVKLTDARVRSVRINTKAGVIGVRSPKDEAHAKRPLHYVRAHYKRRKNHPDERIFIQGYWRGDPSLGTVQKTYEVV